MATWEQRMQESEEEGLAGTGVPEDTLKVLTLQKLQDAPREATSSFTREGGREAGEHLL